MIRPTLTKRRKLGGELTLEQWDIIHAALEEYADNMSDTLSELDDPAELELTSNHHAETCAISALLERNGIDGRSVIVNEDDNEDELD